jgi:hypothetical protein
MVWNTKITGFSVKALKPLGRGFAQTRAPKNFSLHISQEATMTFAHPLDFIPAEKRRGLFFIFLALTLAFFAIFRVLDQPLQTSASTGIVSFELARTVEKAAAMVASWDAAARISAAFGLGLDYLFMPVYATALSLGLLLAANRRRGLWSVAGKALGWAAYAATAFDAMENLALYAVLNGNLAPFVPHSAFWCACVKFGLLLIGLVYSLVGWFFPQK